MSATSSVMPRKLFWLLAALVLPLANVGAIVAAAWASGDAWIVTAIVCAAAELALLGWVLSRQGLAGGRLAGWLAAGAASATVATAVYTVAAFFVVLLIAAAQCPPDAYECPI